MSDLSRDTSPDPITLPSSPLSGRKPKNVRSTRKPTPARRNARASPSKSLILDTPQAGDASPWRIKVTVQAEPRDGSPGKKTTKTMTVPLESPSKARRSSSPTKKQSPEKKRVTRKRKAGTPIKERRSAPQLRKQQNLEPESEAEAEAEALPKPVIEPATDEEDGPALPSQTPPRRASGRLARLSAQWSNGTGRTKRLSMAREELDQALQDAMGPDCEGLGDMTLNRAEDFTMVSLESLQTAKEASLAHISHMNADRSHLDKSGLSVSYLPSSPPKSRYPDISESAANARSSLGSPFEPTPQKRTPLSVPFSTKSSAKGRSSLRHEVDAMSWKPTGLAKLRPLSGSAQPAQASEDQWRQERHAVSQQISNADAEDVVVLEDNGNDSDDQANEEEELAEDLWQDEASRPIETDGSGDEREELVDPDFRPTHSPSEAEDPNYKPHSSSKRSEKFQDLFAHIPDKPLRPKIPRTWRRSSGMDFSYIDSPAHPPPVEAVETRRHSTDGSGVLTPPSTDESEPEIEENNATAEMQEEADDQLQSEYTQAEHENIEDDIDSGELQDEVDDQLQSEFTQPEAEATRFHQDDYDEDEMIDAEGESSRNDSKDPLDDGGADGSVHSPPQQDATDLSTSNTSNAHLKGKPKRRPARKPTMDLEDLLNLKSSPQKAASLKQDSAQKTSSSAHHHATDVPGRSGTLASMSSALRDRIMKSNIAKGNASVNEGVFNSVRTDDLLTNPPVSRHLKDLRDSGVKHFDNNGQYPSAVQAKVQPVVETTAPKRRGRQYFGRNHPNNSQTESTVTDSFASKDNMQPPAHPQVQVQVRQVQSQLKPAPQPRPFYEPAATPKEKMTLFRRNDFVERGQYVHRVEHPEQYNARRPPVQAPEPRRQAIEEMEQSLSAEVDTYEEHEDMDEVEEEEQTAEPMPSYQENLNLDSPTKIKINFNDSSTRDSSWLSPAKRRPPLFDTQLPGPRSPPIATSHSQMRPVVSHHDSGSSALTGNIIAPSQPDLFSRLSRAFWSAVQHPPPPEDIIPTLQPKPYEAPIAFPATLRSQIRSRYGVLSEDFPWTMAHMRTLHRMLNSTLSGRIDSIIPRKGKLPTELEKKLNTMQTSVAGYRYRFEKEHAYTIFAFSQTLVPQTTVEAMRNGEVEMLGDEIARQCREYYDPQRHGDDVVYPEEKPKQTGKLGILFLVQTLGDCVKANHVLQRKLEDEGRGEEFENECFGPASSRPGTRAQDRLDG